MTDQQEDAHPESTSAQGAQTSTEIVSPPEACFIERTFDIEKWEADLEYLTVFIQVVGTRPPVQPEEAKRAIAVQFMLPEESLEIHRVTPPEDFLLRVLNHGALL